MKIAPQKQVWIAIAMASALLVGLTVWHMSQPAEPEPVYQGKRLSEWLVSYNPALETIEAVTEALAAGPQAATNVTGAGGAALVAEAKEPHHSADAALRDAGPKAIPTLLRMLRAHDSVLKSKLLAWAKKQNIVTVRYIPAETLNFKAEHGFEVLGTNGQRAVSALIDIVNQDISPQSQSSAIHSLSFIGPAAKEAVPALSRWATNEGVRWVVICALGDIHADPEWAVPVLTNALHDTNSTIQFGAACALQQFGETAKLAVPALIEFFGNPDAETNNRLCAANALRLIDRETAAKTTLPLLLRWAEDGDLEIRSFAIMILGRTGEPEQVLPALLNALRDQDDGIQFEAIEALEHFGPDSKAAVPALVEYYKASRDVAMRGWTADIVLRIDPEAAAKAGITNAP